MSILSAVRLARKTLGWYFSENRDLQPPPGYIKRWILKRLGRRFGLRVFVETGTYQGSTIDALRGSFDRIHSIELGDVFFNAAQKKFESDPRISIHHGDSSTILPKILSDIREPALFWLDAHYSEGNTARGRSDTPIREELRAILTHPVPGHVIVIDDARDFGTGDYPTIDEIRSEGLRWGARNIRLANNMLILEQTGTSHGDNRALSQFGEDEIIARLLEAVGIENHQCIEFGAFDGLRGSNTAQLWRNENWKALLIETDKSRFENLLTNVAGKQVVPVRAHVAIAGEYSIDSIARRYGFGPVIDMLSIDIDGNDYWIFDSLTYLKPRIIVCEYNPTIPPDRDLVGKPDSRIGCSAASLISLADKKGYVLCGATQSNLIFVHKDLQPQLTAAGAATGGGVPIPPTNLCYVISDYDGNYSFSKPPSYGIRAPERSAIYQTDLTLVTPHPTFSRVISAYHRIRLAAYRFRKWFI